MDRDDDKPNVPGERPRIGTYTPPAPYRVFRVIQGGAKHIEPSRAFLVDGDTTSTVPEPPHETKT
jgi:hypothetical protein